MGTTRRKILELLKRRGPQTSAELAKTLGVTAVAVRQHVQILSDRGLLVSRVERHHVGRPAQRWDLSSEAQALFPDEHERLALDLIQVIDETLGRDVLERVLAERTERQIERYLRQMPGPEASLEQSIKALVRLRNKEGHMAECIRDGNGGFIVVHNHCPICAAADRCKEICELEPELLTRSLGGGVVVERMEYARNGSKRCAFTVQPGGSKRRRSARA